MSIKLILFDWDMTLANTLSFKLKLLRLAKKKYKISLLKAFFNIRKLLGMSVHQVFEEIFGKKADSKKLLIEYRKAFKQHCNMIKFKGKKTLNLLKKKGYKIGIITNELKSNLSFYLKRNNIKLDVILSTHDFAPKPNPKIINYVLKKFKVGKKEVVYIGDHPNDIILGKNAGINTIAISTAIHSKRSLKKHKPDLIVRNIKKINSDLLNKIIS